MKSLPKELLRLIVGFLPLFDRRVLALSYPRCSATLQKYTFIDRSRFLVSVRGYEELLELDCPLDEEMLRHACRLGSAEVVRLIRAKGIPWGTECAALIVKNGNMELLDWALSDGATPDDVERRALTYGCIEALEIMRRHEFPMDRIGYLATNAAAYGHIPAIEWLMSQGNTIPWDDVLVSAALSYKECQPRYIGDIAPVRGLSHVDTVRWVLQYTKTFPDALTNAASGGNVEVFDLLYKPAFIYESSAEIIARCACISQNIDMIRKVHGLIPAMPELLAYDPPIFRNSEVAEWGLNNGLGLEKSMTEAAGIGNLPLLKFLHEHGCPHDEKTILWALRSRNAVKMHLWMVENGFKFDPQRIRSWEGVLNKRIYGWLVRRYKIE